MKNVRAKIAAVAIAAAALVAMPVAASAATNDYSPVAPSAGTIIAAEDGTATVSFEDFGPNEPITFYLSGENASGASLALVKAAYETNANIGSRTADGQGNITVTVNLPANATGEYLLTADGAWSDNNPTQRIVAGALPPTGFDAASMTGVWIGGGALLAAGIAVTSVAMIRRRQAEQA